MTEFSPNVEDILSKAEEKLEAMDRKGDSLTIDQIRDIVEDILPATDEYDLLIQYTYYTEELLRRSEPFPRSAISHHVVERADTIPEDVTVIFGKNTLEAHLLRKFTDDELTNVDETTEPKPGTACTEYSQEAIITNPSESDFPELLDDIYPETVDRETITVTDDKEAYDLEHSIGDNLLGKLPDWCWTKKAAFVRYLLTKADTDLIIEEEQIDGEPFETTINSLIYWAWVTYFRSNLTITEI